MRIHESTDKLDHSSCSINAAYPNCCDHCVIFQCSPASQRHSAFLSSSLLITWIAHAYIYNPEINKETEFVSARGDCESLAQNPSQMWGPQGLLMWSFHLGALNSEIRASRGQLRQLKATDFTPAVAALPSQVEWTDLLFFSFLAPRRRRFTHLRTSFPNMLPHHLAKFVMPNGLTWKAKLNRWEPGLYRWRARSICTKIRADQEWVLFSDLPLLCS